MRDWTPTEKDLVRNLAVKIESQNEEGKTVSGSGILINYDGRPYVLTAQHCVPALNVSNMTLVLPNPDANGILNPIALIPKTIVDNRYIPESNIDYAIIEVASFPNNIPSKEIKWECQLNSSDSILFGYPEKEQEGTHISLTYDGPAKWKYEGQINYAKDDFESYVSGFSGAGIFDVVDDELRLHGILRCIVGHGTYGNVRSCSPTLCLSYFSAKPDEDKKDIVPVPDVEGYIERYCSYEEDSGWNLYLDKDDERLTLFDFVMGKADKSSSNRFALVGSAQLGKSFELKHLQSLLTRNHRNALFIELPKMADFNFEELDLHEDDVLILDALDEIANQKMHAAAEAIRTYVQTHPGQTVVVSCRANFAESLKNLNFHILKLDPLNYSDIKSVIEQRLHDNGKFFEELKTSSIWEFCDSPFNLNFLIDQRIANGDDRSIAHNIFKLYESYIATHFKIEEGKTIKENEASLFHNMRMLSEIAITMMMTEKNELELDELEKIVSGDKNLRIIKRNEVVSFENDKFRFKNNTVKEFLAAEYLSHLPLHSIKSFVCFQANNEIKPQWHNVIALWLQYKIMEEGEIHQDILDWVGLSSKDIFINCDPNVIDESVRLEIVKSIFDNCKKNGSFFDSYYTGHYSKLYRFGKSNLLHQYLLQELRQTQQKGPHLYNIVCLIACIDWNYVKETDLALYDDLKKELLEKIRVMGDNNESFPLFYWILACPIFYESTEFVDSLFNLVNNYTSAGTRRAMCDILRLSKLSDKYADYLIESEKLIQDHGYTIVSRSELYQAFSSLNEKGNIVKVLDMVMDKDIIHKENWRNDLYSMLRILSEKLVSKDNGVDDFKRLFFKIFPEDRKGLYLSTDKEIFNIFSAICENHNIQDSDVSKRIDTIRSFGKLSKEEIALRKTRSNKLFSELWDYDIFKAKVLGVIEKLKQEDESSDFYKHCFDEENGYEKYVADFIGQSLSWPRIDIERVTRQINDHTQYLHFCVQQTINEKKNSLSNVDVSDDIWKRCQQTCEGILQDLTNGVSYGIYDEMALELFASELIDLPKEEALKLLNFSHLSFTAFNQDSCSNVTMSVFEAISNKFERKNFVNIIREMVEKQENVSQVNMSTFLLYLIDNGEPSDLNVIFDFIKKYPNSALAYQCIERLIDSEKSIDQIISYFDIFSLEDKLVIAEKIPSEKMNDTIISSLENAYSDASDFHKHWILRLLVRHGNLMAISEINANKEWAFKQGEFYNFSYDNGRAIKEIVDIIGYVVRLDSIYNSVLNTLYNSLATISATNQENFEAVISAIDDLISKNPELLHLNQVKEYCKRVYLQSKEQSFSIPEAIEKIK